MELFDMADQWGRELARADFEKAAHVAAFESAARALAKTGAIKDYMHLLTPAVNWAKQHPGAAIGGALGAAHGLMKQDGGVGSAVLEGAGGAALGHGFQAARQGLAVRSTTGRASESVLKPGLGEAAPTLHPPDVNAFAAKPSAKSLVGYDKAASATKVAFPGGMLLGSLAGGAARAGMGAALKGGAAGAAGGLGGFAQKGLNFLKQNPMKAVGVGLNAVQGVSQAKQQGQGIGGALMNGVAQGAQAL